MRVLNPVFNFVCDGDFEYGCSARTKFPDCVHLSGLNKK